MYSAPHYTAPGYSTPVYFLGLNGLAAVHPNPRRTLEPVLTGYAGRDFAAATPEQDDAYTFNLSRLLVPRKIAAVLSFTLELVAPIEGGDADAAARVLAGPSVDFTRRRVTVRLGGWPAGQVALYRATVLVRDSERNTFDSFAGVPIAPRADASWSG